MEGRHKMEAEGTELDTLQREVGQVLRSFRSNVEGRDTAWLSSCLVRRQLERDRALAPAAALERAFESAMDELSAANTRGAELLRYRFLDDRSPDDLLLSVPWLAVDRTTFFKWQRRAVDTLAQILIQQEAVCRRASSSDSLVWRLPLSSYRRRLLGIDRPAARLLQHLQEDTTHIICVKGIGGIGKTALTDHVLRLYLATNPRLVDLVWVTAKQEYLTETGIVSTQARVDLDAVFDRVGLALGVDQIVRRPLEAKIESLARILRQAPHLVVLDNLEAAQDFGRIVPLLSRLANPTKFLLTSRETVPAAGLVDEVRLSQLDSEASLALVREVAEDKCVSAVPAEAVVAAVGGNPLAIIWAVSLMHDQKPEGVLADLRSGRAEEVYLFIFRKSWSALNPEARSALMAIYQAGDLADWDWLSMGWQGDPRLLRQGLSQLTSLSLAELTAPYTYSIHRLTSTFLRTEVLGWK